MNGLDQEYSDRVQFVYVEDDLPEGQELARKYDVPGHPACVILDNKGNVVQTFLGIKSRNVLEQGIKEVLAQKPTHPAGTIIAPANLLHTAITP